MRKGKQQSQEGPRGEMGRDWGRGGEGWYPQGSSGQGEMWPGWCQAEPPPAPLAVKQPGPPALPLLREGN